MARPLKSTYSTRGKGTCGTPFCPFPKAPDHFLCEFHVGTIAHIKQEIEEEIKAAGRHGRRQGNDRTIKIDDQTSIQAPNNPTCCALGCFEPRIPPNSYCIGHETLETAFAD